MTSPTTPPGLPTQPPTAPHAEAPTARAPSSLGAANPLPSATTAPSNLLAFAAMYRLMLRSTATRGRLIAVGSLTGLSLLSAVIARFSKPDDSFLAGIDFAGANLGTLLPVAVLVFGAGTLGDLIDDGSLVYLWLRPIPTHLHAAAAWAATATIVLPLVGVPVLFATSIIEPDPGLLAGTALALFIGTLSYAALSVTAGVRFRRALPWGLIYVLLWEGFVAGAGSNANRLAIRSYLRSILSELADHPLKLAQFNLASGVVTPLVVGALALVYASRRLARSDIA